LKIQGALGRRRGNPRVPFEPSPSGVRRCLHLWMCRIQARRLGAGDSEMLFQLHVRNDDQEETPPLVTLKAHCGPGDDSSAVVTLMLPEED